MTVWLWMMYACTASSGSEDPGRAPDETPATLAPAAPSSPLGDVVSTEPCVPALSLPTEVRAVEHRGLKAETVTMVLVRGRVGAIAFRAPHGEVMEALGDPASSKQMVYFDADGKPAEGEALSWSLGPDEHAVWHPGFELVLFVHGPTARTCHEEVQWCILSQVPADLNDPPEVGFVKRPQMAEIERRMSCRNRGKYPDLLDGQAGRQPPRLLGELVKEVARRQAQVSR